MTNPYWPNAPLPTVDEADPRQLELLALIVAHAQARADLQAAYELIAVDPAMQALVGSLSIRCGQLAEARLDLIRDMAGHNLQPAVVPQIRNVPDTRPATPTEKPAQLGLGF